MAAGIGLAVGDPVVLRNVESAHPGSSFLPCLPVTTASRRETDGAGLGEPEREFRFWIPGFLIAHSGRGHGGHLGYRGSS